MDEALPNETNSIFFLESSNLYDEQYSGITLGPSAIATVYVYSNIIYQPLEKDELLARQQPSVLPKTFPKKRPFYSSFFAPASQITF